MSELLDAKDVRALLAIYVGGLQQLGISQNGAAKRMGVSNSHLSRVLRGEKQPGEKVLSWLGLKEAMRYQKVSAVHRRGNRT